MRDSRRRAAHEEAHKQLMASLNAGQREQYQNLGYFDVVSNLGNTFRIQASGHIGNIFQLVPGSALTPWPVVIPLHRQFCCHLSGNHGYFPDDDHLLAQALMIRTDEVAFRATACSIA